MVVKTSTTAYVDGGYSQAGDQITYNYAVTDTGPDPVTNIAVNDNKIPSADITCPSSPWPAEASETCTGSYTVTQADVDNGSVTNTATVSATNASTNETVTSAPSSVTVDASDATTEPQPDQVDDLDRIRRGRRRHPLQLPGDQHRDDHAQGVAVADDLDPVGELPGHHARSPGRRRPAPPATR